MTPPTLLQALTQLPALTRETLSHLTISRAGKAATCTPDPDHGDPFHGPLDAEVPLMDQLLEVAASHLWGTLAWSEVDDDLVKVQMWAGAGEREAWRRRMLLANRSPMERTALQCGGEVKLSTWRRDNDMLALRAAVRAADERAVVRTDLIALTQVARSTLYTFLKDAPETTAEPAGGPTVSWTASTTPTPSSSTPAPPTQPSPEPRQAGQPRRGGPGELVRMPSGHSAPCVICSTPATMTIGADPIHQGECLRAYEARSRDEDPSAAPISAPASAPTAAPDAPTETPAPTDPSSSTRPRPKRSARGRAPREDRFAALAVALDAEWLYLPGGEVRPWAAEHLGDLAMLVEQYRLGHGGGNTLPERGEIWLYPSALDRLGLPQTVGIDRLTQAPERAEQTHTLFRELNDLPVVADAMAQGWEFDKGRMDQRTRLKHPERLRQGAHIISTAWSHLDDMPLFTDEQGQFVSPAVLVERLQSFAEHVGIAFRITPGVTGQDLIDHTRPPRGSSLEEHGAAITAVRDERPQLPPMLEDRHDSRMFQLETNFSWWREWGSLLDREKSCTYVHAYDHRSHFLNPWGSTDLGVEDLIHLEGEEARWDGKSERAAYYLVSRWETPDWSLPDPANGLRGFVEGDRVWVSGHTLKQLEKLSPGMTSTLRYDEAWTWQVHTRYLSQAGKILAAARLNAPAPVADTVKEIYSATSNKLASRDLRPNYHLRRPDWRDMVIASSRTAIIAALIAARDRSGVTPLVVDRDTIIYASDEPDPIKAWPGDPEKFDSPNGGWRATATATLADWGPTALAKRMGAWLYNTHMGAMTLVK